MFSERAVTYTAVEDTLPHMLSQLERLRDLPDVAHVFCLRRDGDRLIPLDPADVWSHRCANAWKAAERRARHLGVDQLASVEVATAAGVLVLVQAGEMVGGAFGTMDAVPSVIAYDLRHALASSELAGVGAS